MKSTKLIPFIFVTCLVMKLEAQTVRKTEALKVGDTQVVYSSLAPNIEFELTISTEQSATITPPSKDGWTWSGSDVECDDGTDQLFTFTAISGHRLPEAAFTDHVTGNVTGCSGSGGGGSDTAFDYTLVGGGVKIEPADSTIAVNESLELSLISIQDSSEVDAENWSSDPSSGVVMSLSSNGVAIVSSDYPMSKIWFRSSEPGEYEITAVPDGGSPSDGAAATLNIIKIEMITPDGDPTDSPDDSGDGQNEFTYDSGNPGVLTINLKAKVYPTGQADNIKDDCVFSVSGIGNSTLAWDDDNPNGKPTVNGDFLEATVTFTGLPTNNANFGLKNATISYDGSTTDENEYEVFYDALASNHPGEPASDPNWFYYYKQNSGGGAYSYINLQKSVALSGGGDVGIGIGNSAYSGGEYIKTKLVGGELLATGWSETYKYYTYFTGVLAHERQHANNEITTGPPDDSDSDYLEDDFEVNTSITDEWFKWSARGFL